MRIHYLWTNNTAACGIHQPRTGTFCLLKVTCKYCLRYLEEQWRLGEEREINKMNIGSIYGEKIDPYLRRYGEVQSIGVGHGGDGDYEYATKTPPYKMIGGKLDIIEIPKCLTLKQFLDIQNSSRD